MNTELSPVRMFLSETEDTKILDLTNQANDSNTQHEEYTISLFHSADHNQLYLSYTGLNQPPTVQGFFRFIGCSNDKLNQVLYKKFPQPTKNTETAFFLSDSLTGQPSSRTAITTTNDFFLADDLTISMPDAIYKFDFILQRLYSLTKTAKNFIALAGFTIT